MKITDRTKHAGVYPVDVVSGNVYREKGGTLLLATKFGTGNMYYVNLTEAGELISDSSVGFPLTLVNAELIIS